MLTYAHVCSRMLTYAHVCSRMLAYAHVCSRMLAYAHVCCRMAICVLTLVHTTTICSAQSRERSHSRRLSRPKEEQLRTLCRGRRGGLGGGAPRSGSGPGTYVYVSIRKHTSAYVGPPHAQNAPRSASGPDYSGCLLYQYKSTNTDP